MFKGIIVFLLMLTIILFPIPIKITLKYSNKVLEIYLYNKKLKIKKPSKYVPKKVSKTIDKYSFIKSFTLYDIKLIINKIANLKFKPSLVLNTKLEYGLDDAAIVAILFGLIHSAYSFLYLILINFVKVKKIDLQVIPHFEEKEFKMKISSIIYTNLAKIIYMAFIMTICLTSITKRNKRINIKKYKGGNVHG